MSEVNSAQIKLSKPLDVDGTKVDTLTMREPTVGDQLVMEEIGGTPGNQEVNLFANLCGITAAQVKKLSIKDYKKIQAAYAGFTG